ncbi:MAG: hypothetical protein IPF98_23820 [Gemmatimonadetes bacterium]|nr:hypothetical protein [Gemmatimonadota bacterium]
MHDGLARRQQLEVDRGADVAEDGVDPGLEIDRAHQRGVRQDEAQSLQRDLRTVLVRAASAEHPTAPHDVARDRSPIVVIVGGDESQRPGPQYASRLEVESTMAVHRHVVLNPEVAGVHQVLDRHRTQRGQFEIRTVLDAPSHVQAAVVTKCETSIVDHVDGAQ